MHKLGVVATLLGLALVIVGLLVGFVELFMHRDSALFWLTLVPFGFVGLFVGITMTQLSKR
jgi:hypothetical protein